MGWRNDRNATKRWAIIGPRAKRHFNGVSLTCRQWPTIECWHGCFCNFYRIRINIARKPYIFVFFQEGCGPPAPPPLDPPMQLQKIYKIYNQGKMHMLKCTGFIFCIFTADVHLKIFPIIYNKWRPNDWIYLSFYLPRELSYAYLGC